MVIGFFMPLPLAMMIPFMGIQSAVMAKQFGENFQYGKRRISAMSNDEFNKLTPKMIQDNANAELKAMIPSMEASIADMRHFQEFMIKEMISTIGQLLRSGLGFLIGIPPEQVNQMIQDIEHFIHGHPPGSHPEAPVSPEPGLPAQPQQPTTGPGPVAPGLPTPPLQAPPIPTSPLIPKQEDPSWLLHNAQGRIKIVSTGIYNLETFFGGKWNKVKQTTLQDALNLANKAWPINSYLHVKVRNIHYWVLKTKL